MNLPRATKCIHIRVLQALQGGVVILRIVASFVSSCILAKVVDRPASTYELVMWRSRSRRYFLGQSAMTFSHLNDQYRLLRKACPDKLDSRVFAPCDRCCSDSEAAESSVSEPHSGAERPLSDIKSLRVATASVTDINLCTRNGSPRRQRGRFDRPARASADDEIALIGGDEECHCVFFCCIYLVVCPITGLRMSLQTPRGCSAPNSKVKNDEEFRTINEVGTDNADRSATTKGCSELVPSRGVLTNALLIQSSLPTLSGTREA
ncbi:hypothetical protein DB88DRAFT_472717 [Papiliotrema laurentii]|uniref:Uncharacterized protein n=1 Tax=Papiliotrema laurentii TaxID=5418 RepID=A0AAD9D2U1_PAPLA|nr:hypothetical protein DB88DRAFT_472717 [Papiliotrema laurentii]